ncbi:MAG: hypothetical protein FD180_1925 [Planctomycetota bacterium]|nr:MAG: hypothetical protein FD180_1925 [Planctomycetota bacterium]
MSSKSERAMTSACTESTVLTVAEHFSPVRSDISPTPCPAPSELNTFSVPSLSIWITSTLPPASRKYFSPGSPDLRSVEPAGYATSFTEFAIRSSSSPGRPLKIGADFSFVAIATSFPFGSAPAAGFTGAASFAAGAGASEGSLIGIGVIPVSPKSSSSDGAADERNAATAFELFIFDSTAVAGFAADADPGVAAEGFDAAAGAAAGRTSGNSEPTAISIVARHPTNEHVYCLPSTDPLRIS